MYACASLIFFSQCVTIRQQYLGKGESSYGMRELRSSHDHLLCKVNDYTGDVETIGPHKTSYVFNIPIGGTFTVTRGCIVSYVTRTASIFTVKDQIAA